MLFFSLKEYFQNTSNLCFYAIIVSVKIDLVYWTGIFDRCKKDCKIMIEQKEWDPSKSPHMDNNNYILVRFFSKV